MKRVTGAVLLAVITGCAGDGPAAEGGAQQLERDAVFPEAFGMVSGFRALSDGRVMVSDPLGQALMLVDMDAGTADTLGRVGAGPEEYQQPDLLFPLPGDSTLLVDLGNARLTVLSPDGQFGESVSMVRSPQETAVEQGPRGGMMVRAMPTFIIPQAADGNGRLYFRAMGGRPAAMQSDSGSVARWDRGDRIDTVATIKLQAVRREERGEANNRSVRIRQVPLSPQDDWTVGPDGRVAVIRAADYHVDWLADGLVTSGTPVRYDPVPVGPGEKERWADDGSAGVSVSVSVGDGRMETSFGRGRNPRADQDLDQYEWPEVLPPFRSGRSRVAPDGTLWVERYAAAGTETRYDRFDGEGEFLGQVTVPAGRRLIGFGDDSVYFVARDDVDLEYLERYRWEAGATD